MKFIVLAILATVLVSSTVVAQHGSPVVIAHRLYEDCMGGYFQASNLKPTRTDIKNFVDAAHEQCLAWMVIWYKPVTGYTMKITEWDDASMDRLDSMIKRTDYMLNIEIRTILGVK